MPHSKSGVPIKVGDSVTLTGAVKQVYEGTETCNIVVEGEDGNTYTLNARNVEVVVHELPVAADDAEPQAG